MLEPGARLAHYEIDRKLGDGCSGGEVYAATDTELGRSVALKILPDALERSEQRRLLEAEAKTIAALDHPNIVRVYGVEESEGLPFIVRELVEGQTIGELVASRPVSLERFFQIAVPLADAVAVAHEHGVTHRDLAPDNVMVDAAGHVKVLDFSMASSSDRAGADCNTGPGRTVDGALFVSPEQIEGKPANPRSDVFLLGLLLYELLTGRHPFDAPTPSESVSALRERATPPLAEARASVPAGLARVVERCLQKSPADRYHNAMSLARELQLLQRELTTGRAAVAPAARPAGMGSAGRFIPSLLVAAVFALLGFLAGRRGVDVERSGHGLDVLSGAYTQLTSGLGLELFPSLSPEGDLVVYASDRDGDWDIYLQRVGGERAINLTESSDVDDTHPAFSPDGQSIAFRSERDGGGIFVMGATGEAERRVSDLGFYPSWSPDGRSLAVTTQNVTDPRLRSGRSQLWVLSLEGDEPRLVLPGDAVQPAWSPGGERIAFWSLVGGRRDIRTVDAAGGEAVPVTADAALDWSPSWSPEGDYLYFSSNRSGAMNLWRVAIDERSGLTEGEPAPVTGGASASVYHAHFSANGERLVYASGSSTQNLWAFGFDPDRAVVTSPPRPVTHDTRAFYHPQVSPDGEWVVAAVENEDLFAVRTDGSAVRRLTDDDHRNREPRFSPDGARIAFQSDREETYDIWSIRRDGSGLEKLTDARELSLIAPVWSPAGDRIACWNPRENSVLVFDVGVPWSEQRPQVIMSPDESKRFFPWSWSSDGRWLAGDFVLPNGAFEGIALYSFETRDVRVLTDYGSGPAFLHDGRRILFVDSQGALHQTDLEGNVVPIPGAPVIDLVQVGRDDRTLFYTNRTERADIWVVRLAR